MSLVSRFRPLAGRVLVKKIKKETVSSGGIVLPDSMQQSLQMAKVIAVGEPRILHDNNKPLVSQVKAGETVVVPDFGGTKLNMDNEEYTLCYSEDILGIITDKA